jgi:hypothetical protein
MIEDRPADFFPPILFLVGIGGTSNLKYFVSNQMKLPSANELFNILCNEGIIERASENDNCNPENFKPLVSPTFISFVFVYVC